MKMLNAVSVALLSLSSAFADLPLWVLVLVVAGCILLLLVLLVIVCLLCVAGKERRKKVLRNGVRTGRGCRRWKERSLVLCLESC